MSEGREAVKRTARRDRCEKREEGSWETEKIENGEREGQDEKREGGGRGVEEAKDMISRRHGSWEQDGK